MTRWNLDPIVLAALLLGCLLAWRLDGVRRVTVSTALAVLMLIFVSPLCALSSSLFAARTAHHLLLIAVAAPLLAWSLPAPRGRPSLVVAAAVQMAVLWLWHAPSAYGWALSNDFAYWLMQFSLLGSAVMFWHALRSVAAPAAVAGLLGTMLQMGLLGALLTFAGQAIYAPHLTTTAAWGLTPLQDQQVAGLIMWAPGSAFYLLAALWMLGRWLGEDDAVATAR
ncbi:cytochrome c oxidase assembly protein [Caulobacter sp. NIBR2454]|uniref:cytochrome c oxidase assembly protein n=1 Tax=Caulobacter sp. NIBR2454 TaxID=3015996 RepID=UPI0022B5F2D7|nr:cytochrome c oxidase assembly protein [Caulobacter sp. NIBR2454]